MTGSEVVVYDVTTQDPVINLPISQDLIDLIWSPDDRFLTIGLAGRVEILEIASQQILFSSNLHYDDRFPTTPVVWDSDGDLVSIRPDFLGSSNIIEVENFTIVKQIETSTSFSPEPIAFLPENQLLIREIRLRLIDYDNDTIIHTYQLSGSRGGSSKGKVFIDDNGQLMLISLQRDHQDIAIAIWEVETGDLIQRTDLSYDIDLFTFLHIAPSKQKISLKLGNRALVVHRIIDSSDRLAYFQFDSRIESAWDRLEDIIAIREQDKVLFYLVGLDSSDLIYEIILDDMNGLTLMPIDWAPNNEGIAIATGEDNKELQIWGVTKDLP
jgi:WD40 repeat protein